MTCEWTTVQMVVYTRNFKKFENFLKSLGGEILLDKWAKRGCFIICQVKISTDKKENLLDSQACFL